MKRGKFIVIEGSDGTGKTTQFTLLRDRLRKEGQDIAEFDFPQYGNPSAHFVEEYLRGSYGTLEELGPYKASLFFALDRFEASHKIRKELNDGKIVVSNRYVGSNMGHQGGKISSSEERKEYFMWVDKIEFEILGIPRPDLSIVLHIPADIAQHLVDEKGPRNYVGGAKRDLHEESLDHLKNSEKTYLEITELFPERFTIISCMDKGSLMDKEVIHEKVWKLVAEEIGL
ncbi:MAG: hypothetical protein A3C03_02340 [Candidatus Colwellbacteria bacterium RIFCSPHIGHO2_02_FULL_45_17]|uniref:Thymidylate kinase n=1 Tax=Candidatus Colwellbacteria bacterium RIFCSPLOWO2_02_FULL_45_11 TaxID=1797692 RepID=A0A1G1Z8Q4_9BACT|nr:MAG: hypothetical protein A3C03_02340 [Candidatus Colwellbacteria bacterium RIFCSPHIGHO2_02_FULL_45_17]OGY60904.1 MAG: hypothetical protein A3I33_02175 [Candidatus Colwellbacteria bacterium RIFCSPLOWO2_02_FULL_45_11]